MREGFVIFFGDRFGFVRTDDSMGKDEFVHLSTVRRAGFDSLARGQRLKFEVGANLKTGRDCVVELQLLEPIISPARLPSTAVDDAEAVFRTLPIMRTPA